MFFHPAVPCLAPVTRSVLSDTGTSYHALLAQIHLPEIYMLQLFTPHAPAFQAALYSPPTANKTGVRIHAISTRTRTHRKHTLTCACTHKHAHAHTNKSMHTKVHTHNVRPHPHTHTHARTHMMCTSLRSSVCCIVLLKHYVMKF